MKIYFAKDVINAIKTKYFEETGKELIAIILHPNLSLFNWLVTEQTKELIIFEYDPKVSANEIGTR
jgi:hypothetical protein